MRYSKPSTVLTSLLPTPNTATKQVKRSVPGQAVEKHIISDYDDSVLYETIENEKYLLLSVSRMNAYFKCPFAFYLQYLLGLTGIPSYFLSYGASIHGCVEDVTPVRAPIPSHVVDLQPGKPKGV